MKLSHLAFPLTFAFAFAFVVLSTEARAQNNGSNNSGRHDRLFVRLNLGVGLSNSVTNDGFGDIEVNGFGASGSFLAGTNIGERTVLHGTLFGHSIYEPTVDLGGESTDLEDTSWTLLGYGPGLQHYLPNDFYIGGSLLLARAEFEYDDGELTFRDESGPGLGLLVNVGREWPINDKVAMGVNAELMGAIIDDDAADPWTIYGASLNASVTFW